LGVGGEDNSGLSCYQKKSKKISSEDIVIEEGGGVQDEISSGSGFWLDRGLILEYVQIRKGELENSGFTLILRALA
jgi:hypothetical protein